MVLVAKTASSSTKAPFAAVKFPHVMFQNTVQGRKVSVPLTGFYPTGVSVVEEVKPVTGDFALAERLI